MMSAGEAVRQEDSRHGQDGLLIGPVFAIWLQEKQFKRGSKFCKEINVRIGAYELAEKQSVYFEGVMATQDEGAHIHDHMR